MYDLQKSLAHIDLENAKVSVNRTGDFNLIARRAAIQERLKNYGVTYGVYDDKSISSADLKRTQDYESLVNQIETDLLNNKIIDNNTIKKLQIESTWYNRVILHLEHE